jgi:hypothetical protein
MRTSLRVGKDHYRQGAADTLTPPRICIFLYIVADPFPFAQESSMVRPKESRKPPRAAGPVVPVGLVVGQRVVIIRDGKFVRPRGKGGRGAGT